MSASHSGNEPEEYGDGNDVLEEKSQVRLQPPPMYQVVMLNDDYTPMAFVIHALERFFEMNRERATQVMLTVHHHGRAVCGVFPKDIAETKTAQVNRYARDNDHPLLCEIEAVTG